MSLKTLAAVAQSTANFGVDNWTTIDLSTVGPNLTDAKPGDDIASVMIENKFSSTGSAYVVFRDDPGPGTAATDGWEVEPGGVLGEDSIRHLRYVSVRATDGAGAIKLLLRSYKTDIQAPWDS